MTVCLAIDCSGGDHGCAVTVPAAVRFVRSHSNVRLLLVGVESELAAALVTLKVQDHPRLELVHAPETVAMDDSIEVALRKRRSSSMHRAIHLVKDGSAQACISAGNTGALMAVSRYILKTFEGIERPAIAALLPNARGYTVMLDLGANTDCTPEHLLQFADMGHAFASALLDCPRPSIGLLNVGEELMKGNKLLKAAGELLRDSPLHFRGNVEGSDVYKGTVDVVVCDGFVGNVALKTSEGLAAMLSRSLRDEFARTLLSRLAALVSWPVLQRFRQRFDPRRYNGAALLGLRGLVVKSHGGADIYGFEMAIGRAYDAIYHGMHAKLGEALAYKTR